MSFISRLASTLTGSKTIGLVVKVWPTVRRIAKTVGLDSWALVDAIYFVLPAKVKAKASKEEILPAAEALIVAYKKLNVLFK